MPKIQAPTVAEHHDRQRRAILDAARTLLAEPGRTAAPSLGEVASRAGLARPSVYQYFSSRDTLFEAVVAELFPAWAAEVQQRMDQAVSPGEKVWAYIESNLDLVSAGEHAVIRGLAATAPMALRRTSTDLHAQLRAPLHQALTDGGEPNPEAMSDLIHAIVMRASAMLEDGLPHDEALALTSRLLGLTPAGTY